MKTFVLFMFVSQVLLTFARLALLAAWEWPHKRDPQTMGSMLANIIIGIILMAWAAALLWFGGER